MLNLIDPHLRVCMQLFAFFWLASRIALILLCDLAKASFLSTACAPWLNGIYTQIHLVQIRAMTQVGRPSMGTRTIN